MPIVINKNRFPSEFMGTIDSDVIELAPWDPGFLRSRLLLSRSLGSVFPRPVCVVPWDPRFLDQVSSVRANFNGIRVASQQLQHKV